MKNKIGLIALPFFLIFLGAGCSNSGKGFADQFVPVESTNPATNTVVTTSTANPPVSPSERGMVALKILNSVTKRGVPGAPIVVSHSSIVVNADANGNIEIPASYNGIYVPKIEDYFASGEINIDEKQSPIEVLLQPEPAQKNFEIVYLEPQIVQSADGSTEIDGKISGSDVKDISISVLNSSLNAVSDQDGNFILKLPGDYGSYRLYFPALKVDKYFQVDVMKGDINKVIIKI